MTNEQLTIIDDLMRKGVTTRTIKMLDGNFCFTIRNLRTEETLEVESSMKSIDTTYLHSIHTFALRLLEYGLTSALYKGEKVVFKTPADAALYLKTKPSSLIEFMITEHSKLEKDVSALLKGDDVENFSSTPSTDSAPNS